MLGARTGARRSSHFLADVCVRPLRRPRIQAIDSDMTHHIMDPRPEGQRGLITEMAAAAMPPADLRQNTPLARAMSREQADWLMEHACNRWEDCYGSLRTWRNKMMVWERQSEMDYSDRIGRPNPNNPESVRDVFSYQNDTLGMAEGFVDFATAQARDDIFGTRPWLGVTPEGRSDGPLAEQITKHANWKLGQSDIEEAAKDGILVACWGGTAFLKSRWESLKETYMGSKMVACSKSADAAILHPGSGDFVTSEGELTQIRTNADDVEWREQDAEESTTFYDNTRTELVDFKDIAFDAKASRLDLAQTDVFCRFRMGLLDLMNHYEIPEERLDELRNAYVSAGEGVRYERGESELQRSAGSQDNDQTNPPVSLVEGFMRCDPLGRKSPVRIHVIFSYELRMIFKVDYLENVTPGGELPVFPCRIHKIPGRIFGIGYFEKYENANNAVDRQHNAITYRDKLSANVISAVQPDALLDDKPKDYVLDGSVPFVLKPDKRINDFVQFAVIPDSNTRANDLLNQQMQMAQMRSGITSAAQGELKGVPSATTATGVSQLVSRGALLLKDPISKLTDDIAALASFNVALLYAHQDRDETFTWGEGEAAELLSIKADDVKGLKMNVSLKLVQSQNQTKLANAQAAIGILANYLSLPQPDKVAARPLFIQAISSLGFNDAETLVRQGVVEAASILPLLPPDVAPAVEQALADAGIVPPPAAPVVRRG